MSWIQIKLSTKAELAGAVEDALLAAGAVAVTLQDNADQPLLEPALGETPLWRDTQVIGLFDADIDQAHTLAVIEQQLKPARKPPHRVEILEDKDWEREWMSNYRPMRFGQRLWICPSWCDPEDPEAVNLLLDPGLAFGTGTHPTTALCLEWLDRSALADKTVIDYGCGSGILGIAALLLGARSVIAVDNDPQALLATRDNAERNGLDASALTTCLPRQLPPEARADIVIANILAGPLVELAPTLARCCKAQGHVAISGILHNQGADVGAAYQNWFTLEQPRQSGDWLLLSGRRRPEKPLE